MQSSENIKNTITKEVYRTILENLLNTKELQDVTTTEIIERSGLSRATFYKHFKDKYELAQWEYDYLMQQLTIETQSTEDSAENIRKIVYFVDSRRHIYKKILKYTGQNSFHEN